MILTKLHVTEEVFQSCLTGDIDGLRVQIIDDLWA